MTKETEMQSDSTADLIGSQRITYIHPGEPKPRWWSRLSVHNVNAARFAEVPSTVLELTGITAVSVGLYQIAPPAGWIGTGIMLIAMGIASSPRTATRHAEPPKG